MSFKLSGGVDHVARHVWPWSYMAVNGQRSRSQGRV